MNDNTDSNRTNDPALNFDIHHAMQSTGGSVDILKRLVAIVIKDLPIRLQGIHEAHATGDFQTASRHLHTIRGQAIHFRSDTLVELTENLESATADGDFSLLDEKMPEVVQSIEQLRTWLSALNWDELEVTLGEES
jgi:HPt (histidine-containing phosphotransfer) domain-containing protein